jgi:hypothetical protein
VTFTLPQPLRSLARTEQKTIYNGRDPIFTVSGKIG